MGSNSRECVSGSAHVFKGFMVSCDPPTESLLNSVNAENLEDGDDLAKVILALSSRRYQVVCTECGMVASVVGEESESDSKSHPPQKPGRFKFKSSSNSEE